MAACGHNVRPRSFDPPGEQLILPDEIAKSGATDAWDVVRRLSHMSTTSTIAGEPSRMYRRGRSSMVIRERPIVVIDGIQVAELEALSDVRADQISWMRILTGAASTTRYGARGGAGAVIVQTLGTEMPGSSSRQSRRAR
ncbi:MAG: TonB-dependent receptor plug domain-containing protein [Gemmatimonadaceae bacterium]